MEFDLTGLSDEELKAKFEELTSKAQELDSKENTTAAEFSAWVSELEAVVAEADAAKAELASRKEVQEKAEALKTRTQEFKAEKEAEVAAAKEAAEKAEAEKAAAEAKAAEEAAKAEAEAAEEAKLAEAKLTPKDAEVPEAQAPVAKAEEADAQEDEKVVALVASADLPGITPGSELSLAETAKAMFARRNHIKGGGSDGEFVLVASADAKFEEDRILTGDWESDQEKIKNVTGTDVIVASGGICAPTEAYYGLELLSGADRPVKSSLTSFGVTRGGIRFMAPPSLSDLSASARVTTEAQDTAGYGGSNGSLTAAKPYSRVTCGSISEVVVDAISSTLVVGNMNARTYPELVETWTKLAAAQHARVAETNLIDKISAASTAVTDAKAYGATGSLLGTLDKAIAGFKSRHRSTSGVNLRVMFPEWTKNLLRTDIAREAPGDDLGRYSVSDGEINAWFTTRGVTVSYYVDTRTGAGMAYGTQSAGAVTDYPATIEWYLWAEGTFLFLDGGTLNLGLVRDSTLNSTNDYSIFVETFENLAFVGHEALRVTSTLQPDGSGPALQTVVTT